MTSKVLVVCPDMSTHNVLVSTEHLQADGTWARSADAFSVAPTEQAPPIYIDGKTRVIVEEEARAKVEHT